jgi:5-methylcytosine-specific restriction endonuclease McrA
MWEYGSPCSLSFFYWKEFKMKKFIISLCLFFVAGNVYEKHHKSSAYALVRSQARTVAKQQGWKSCCKCGYDKHIEIAHIKPISDYSPDTKINVINDPKNLMPLCPNCHWEFDHK